MHKRISNSLLSQIYMFLWEKTLSVFQCYTRDL